MGPGKRRKPACFLVISLLISSCGRVPFRTPTIAPSPALTLTPTSSPTLQPTQTPTTTPTPSPTFMPTPVPFRTPVPLPPTSEPFGIVGQIGGPTQAVAAAGDYAYVGVGLRLVILDTSEPGALREVGSSEPFGYFVEDVALSQETAYVAAGGAGLYVVDISNPALPIIVGNYDTAGYAESVTAVGTYAYVADGPDGLHVFDITNPAQPAEVSAAYKLNYAFDMVVDAGYAYVAAAGAGLLVADVSDPLQPKEAGSLDTPGYAFGIALSGSVAYVADGWEGLRIVDVSTPSQPQEFGFYEAQGWVLDVAAADGIAYAAFAFNGLEILDVSASNQPREVGSYDMLGHHLGGLALGEGTVYLTSRDTGLSILDVTSPAEVVRTGFYNPVGFANAVAVSGSFAYVAAGPYGLRIVDISKLDHPREVGAYDTKAFALGVLTSGAYAYVFTGVGDESTPTGMHVVDVSDPTKPRQASFFAAGIARDVILNHETILIADEAGVEAVDVSNPASPVRLSALDFTQGEPAHLTHGTTGVAVTGDHAYLTDGGLGLQVVDISDPGDAAWVGNFKSATMNSTYAVTVGGQYAYVSDGPNLHIVDISDPTNLVETGLYSLPVDAERMTFANDRLYVADSRAGMVMLDVSDPTHPSLAGWRRLPGYAFGLTAADNYLYVADGEGGLFIIEDSANRGSAGLSTGVQPNAIAGGENSVFNISFQASNNHNLPPVQHGYLTASRKTESVIGVRQTGFFAPVISQPGGSTLTVTSTADSGSGTLRWAIESARSGDTIVFDPLIFPPDNPATIYPSVGFPALSAGNVTIDASNAGVILDGSQVVPPAAGLDIQSDNNVIKGLQIINFPAKGIIIRGANNTIGGDRTLGIGPLGSGNLVSGNGGSGIELWEVGAVNNRIIGNLIGTDLTGQQAYGNTITGVGIDFGASNNVIGGVTAAERNVISGNARTEVGMGLQANGNQIVGNYIGTNASGQVSLGNAWVGVAIETGGFNNVILANVISSNGITGVIISDWGSWGNEVIGNFLGVDPTGGVSLGGQGGGIDANASLNRIGGTRPEERNIISGNNGAGIKIGFQATTDVFVVGNYVGTDLKGISAIPNQRGVWIAYGTRHTFIGGATESERNLISGNNSGGIEVEGFGNDNNFILGNYIGTGATGENPLPNREAGISIDAGNHNFVQSNLIAFNKNNGINIVSGNNNQVHHNSFIRNGSNFDNGTGNAWDNGSEGNYWSDYTGRDEDGNGIGDTPYNVPSNGVDNYPVMEPFRDYVSFQRTMTSAWSSKAH